MAEFANELLALYEEPFRATPTRQKVQQVLGQVMQLPGVQTVADITPATVGAWVRAMIERNLNRVSIDSYLRELRVACGYAVRQGYLAANPVESRPHWLPHDYDGRPARGPSAVPTAGQVERLLNLLLDRSITWEGHRLLALVATVAYTGLRRLEATKLRWEDCDTGARRLRVMSRSLARRVRPMPGPVAVVLDQWRPHCGCEWVFPGSLRKGPWTGGPPGGKALHRLREAGLAVGIEALSFDRLAAFWSSQLERVSLPGFEDRPPPRRTYLGPEPKAPGPPKLAVPLLRLDASRRRALVRGVPARLNETELRILKAMVALGCLKGERVSAKQVAEKSGNRHAARIILMMSKRPPLDHLFVMPGRRGRPRLVDPCGYGFNVGGRF
jgi:hypothetical protein